MSDEYVYGIFRKVGDEYELDSRPGTGGSRLYPKLATARSALSNMHHSYYGTTPVFKIRRTAANWEDVN